MAMVAVAAAGCSGTQSLSVGCSKDTDCRAPRVCEHSRCVDPRPGAPEDAQVAAVADAAPAAPGAPPFAMFGGDAQHTGRRGGPAPRTQPALQWRAPVGG